MITTQLQENKDHTIFTMSYAGHNVPVYYEHKDNLNLKQILDLVVLQCDLLNKKCHTLKQQQQGK